MLNTMPNKVREYQLTGIFEELIMSGRNEIEVISSSISYPLIFQFFRLICYFFAINFVSKAYFFLIISLIFLWFQYCYYHSLNWYISNFNCLYNCIQKPFGNKQNIPYSCIGLSGVAFPIELLPNFLMNLGSLLPSTHFLELIRADMINNELDFLMQKKVYLF